MSDPLVLYTNPMSRGRIARWMLEEVGQPYRVEIVDFAAPRPPAFLALNPLGQVPVRGHGETVVTECAAICADLADAFPGSGLAPEPGSPARGAYYRWLFFGAGPTEAAVTNRSLGVDVPPERRGMVGYGDYATVLDTLEQALARGPFLLGERFSAADVYLGSQISWGLAFGSMEERAGFKDYVLRIAARPAAVRANAADDALMPAKKG